MDKKWRFHDTSATYPECAPIRFVRYRQSHVALLGLCPYSAKAKNMVKSTVSMLFASLFYNCEQSHTLSTNNEVSMTSVQNVRCSASSTVVLPKSKSWSSLLQYEYTSGKQNTKNSTVSVLFKVLYTLDLKPRGGAKWLKCAKIHVLCTGNKDNDTEVWLCRMSTTQSGAL